MKRKLASCSSKGRLTFSRTLLYAPKEERNKVILHELLHLRYPNHGKMFKLMFNTYNNNIVGSNSFKNEEKYVLEHKTY